MTTTSNEESDEDVEQTSAVETNQTTTESDDDDDERAVDEDLAAALASGLRIETETKEEDDATEQDDGSVALERQRREQQIRQWRGQAPASIRQVARWIASEDDDGGKTCQRILVLTGAGVSVAAGIPDFRTPGTGLYDNLRTYDLPYPEAVFDVDFYRRDPHPFVRLASELWPGLHKYYPTLTHSFITLLHQKGLLVRCYTQNIDGLEHLANLPAEALVECHGHFRTASCTNCGTPAADPERVKHTIVHEVKPPSCAHCDDDDGGYVKPDIVFFGEGLPSRFHRLLRTDVREADCCLILGTSLQVAPVSAIPEMVNRSAKRILCNRELVGDLRPPRKPHDRARDVFCPGDCDTSVEWLAKCLGWWPELQSLHDEMLANLKAAAANDRTKSNEKTSKNKNDP